MEAEATVESKSWLKRFSHGRRFNLALELLELSGNERVLDYGTGEGFMLQRILDRHPQCRLVGYEPEPQEYAKLIKKMGDRRDSAHLSLIDNLDATTVRSFDVLCCLEVFEHLSDAHQQKALADLINFTADHGKIVISVPIETGISSLLKNTVRILLRQTHPNTTAKTVFYSLFGLKIMRGGGGGGGGHGHIGFDYRALEKMLTDAKLKITTKTFSPFKPLGGLLNSQVFFVLHKP